MNKFMPKKPQFTGSILGPYGTDAVLLESSFNTWWSAEIAPLFENAVEVYNDPRFPAEWYTKDHEGVLAHQEDFKTKGFIVNQQPTKEETELDHLKALVAEIEAIECQSYRWLNITGAFEKAKAYLERKK